MTDLSDVHGPIDIVVLEFDADAGDGSAAQALMDLVDQGIVRIFDLLVITKDADGSIAGIELTDLSADSLGGFAAFSGARSGLVGDDDVAAAGELLEPGKAAALIVYENTWAIPFVAAARNAGAELVASTRIPASVLMEVLDELEAADAG